MGYLVVGVGSALIGGVGVLGWVIYQMERDNPERIKKNIAKKMRKK